METPSFVDNMKRKFTSMFSSASESGYASSSYLVYVLITLGLLAISYLVYEKYWNEIKNRISLNSEYDEKKDLTAEVMFFKTNWCPHSKEATPIWEEIKQKYNNEVLNGHKVIFTEIDCEKDESKCDEFKIEGYPTIKINLPNEIVEFDGNPSKDGLEQFITNVIGTPKEKSD